jgi:dolichol-phosphate mannosyltransferase
MDADLQDPPSAIAGMVEAWQDGADIVVGRREARPGERAWRHGATHIFSATMRRFTSLPISAREGEFRLLDRKAVDAIRSMKERPTLLRAASSWIGFKVAAVPYARSARHAGDSAYSKRRLFALGIDTLMPFSNRPLRIAGWAAAAFLAAGAAGLLYALIERAASGAWPGGWTILLFVNLLLVGVQLSILAVIGAYLGRIYDEVKGRPSYLVAAEINAPAGDEAEAPERR